MAGGEPAHKVIPGNLRNDGCACNAVASGVTANYCSVLEAKVLYGPAVNQYVVRSLRHPPHDPIQCASHGQGGGAQNVQPVDLAYACRRNSNCKRAFTDQGGEPFAFGCRELLGVCHSADASGV